VLEILGGKSRTYPEFSRRRGNRNTISLDTKIPNKFWNSSESGSRLQSPDRIHFDGALHSQGALVDNIIEMFQTSTVHRLSTIAAMRWDRHAFQTTNHSTSEELSQTRPAYAENTSLTNTTFKI